MLAHQVACALGTQQSARANGSLEHFGRVDASMNNRFEEQPRQSANMRSLLFVLPRRPEPRQQEKGKLGRHAVLLERPVDRHGLVSCHERAARWDKVRAEALIHAVHKGFEHVLVRAHPVACLCCARLERRYGSPKHVW